MRSTSTTWPRPPFSHFVFVRYEGFCLLVKGIRILVTIRSFCVAISFSLILELERKYLTFIVGLNKNMGREGGHATHCSNYYMSGIKRL